MLRIIIIIKQIYVKQENVEIRRSSFVLFGNLHRFGDGPCKAVFYEQIHTNFVTLLVHLNEEEPSVKQVRRKERKKTFFLCQHFFIFLFFSFFLFFF
jgi:hypothetical protein